MGTPPKYCGPQREEVPVSGSRKKRRVCVGEYDAWLFDLDGVVTDTASVRAAAWKEMFDGYLREISEREGIPFTPFEVDPDYYSYVDGKPRLEGVDAFLRSRGIVLRWGTPEDPPNTETVCGLGNRKNTAFNEVLRARGAEVFESSVVLIRELRSSGARVAVVTSSKNGEAVLTAAGILSLFDARVDGNVAAERKLTGKPAPDTFEEAARMLEASPERAVVVEDAVSGVRAGRGLRPRGRGGAGRGSGRSTWKRSRPRRSRSRGALPTLEVVSTLIDWWRRNGRRFD